MVYEFVCRKHGDSYIGKTCRSFRGRYLEHRSSIRNKDSKSALSVDVCACECITDFDVTVLNKKRDHLNSAFT